MTKVQQSKRTHIQHRRCPKCLEYFWMSAKEIARHIQRCKP